MGKRRNAMQNYSPNVKAVIGYLPLKFEIPQHPRYTARLLSKHLFGYKRDRTEGGCLFLWCSVTCWSVPAISVDSRNDSRKDGNSGDTLSQWCGAEHRLRCLAHFLLLSFSITLHRESVSPIVKLVLNLLKRSLETHTILG